MNQMELFVEEAGPFLPEPGKFRFFSSDEEIISAAIEIKRKELNKGVLLNSVDSAKDYLVITETKEKREVFRTLWLDSQYRLISEEIISVGTLNQASVYPREVAHSALMARASAVIISHNHPTGIVNPSKSDKLITDRLQKTLELLDIKLIDHIITGCGNSFSFAENNML